MKLVNVVAESPDGYKWLFRDGQDDHLALGGHEAQLAPFFQSLNSKDKAFINVGAHVGTWAIRASKWAKTVYAVEANPATFAVLQVNMALNELPNVIGVRAAIWDNNVELVTFVDENDKETGGSTRLQSLPEDSKVRGVRTRTLDYLFEDIPEDIGLISMDVEGAEAHVLRGAELFLSEDRPNLIIELHEGHVDVDKDIRAQVESILTKQNYTWQAVHLAMEQAEYYICQPAELVEEYPSE